MTAGVSSSPPSTSSVSSAGEIVGRYAIFDELASGGMATVYIGRLVAAAGFSRLVAIKRLHPNLARDVEFASMFIDEARLAARIRHPCVVPTLDVVAADREILLIMEYVHGLSLAQLLGAAQRLGKPPSPRVVASILVGVLEGLHAAHEATSESGQPLGVVHRDVSPQNILVGIEGLPRLLDFGVAKAIGKLHDTRDGQIKGKLAYLSPEQARGAEIGRKSDVFAASVVLWEALTGARLFDGNNAADQVLRILEAPIDPPSKQARGISRELDAVVMRGLSRDQSLRFSSAAEMASALEAAAGVASSREVAAWVKEVGGETLATRARLVAEIERRSIDPARAAAANGATSGGDAPLSSGRPSLPGVPPTPERAPTPSSDRVPGDRDDVPPLWPLPTTPRPVAIAKPPGPSLSESVGLLIERLPEPLQKLHRPLGLVLAGIVISVVSSLISSYTTTWPVRPSWLGGALLLVGAAWGLVVWVRDE